MDNSSLISSVKLSQAAEDNEYKISFDNSGRHENLDAADIIALFPKTNEEHILVCLSSGQLENTGAKFSLRKYRVLQKIPSSLSKFTINPSSLELLKPALADTKSISKLSIIVSVKSGTCQAEAFFHEVVEELLNLLDVPKSGYQVHITDSEKWIADFASETLGPLANQGISQSVLLLSGDGGMIDVLNGLHACPRASTYVKPNIGLLVLGTGNALANSSGLNVGNTKGLSDILLGSPQSIPTFLCKCSPGSELLINEARDTEHLRVDKDGNGIVHGAVVASWCLHATLVADSDTTEYRKHGSERFSMAANELLAPSDGSDPHKWKGKITTWHTTQSGKMEEKVWEREEHMYILATMVSNLEAALKISPESKPLDGQLRLVEFPPLPVDDVKSIFGMAFSGGKHVEHENVGYMPIEGLRIEFNESDARWRRICVDGKIIRVPENGWMEVRRDKDDVANLMIKA